MQYLFVVQYRMVTVAPCFNLHIYCFIIIYMGIFPAKSEFIVQEMKFKANQQVKIVSLSSIPKSVFHKMG